MNRKLSNDDLDILSENYTDHPDYLKAQAAKVKETLWVDSFDIDITYNEYTGHFFINFNKGGLCLISQKVTEGQAVGIAKHLGLKIRK